MKKILIALLALFAATANAAESDEFYNVSIAKGEWAVIGTYDTESLGPTCRAKRFYGDGSSFGLAQDLVKNEIYMVIHANLWQIAPDEHGKHFTARLNFITKRGAADGNAVEFFVVDKNTVIFEGFGPKLLAAFSVHRLAQFIMPGSISNVTIDLAPISTVIEKLRECVVLYNKLPPRAVRKKA